MSDEKISRTVLPIPDVGRAGLITYDAKDPDTRFPPIRDLRPPAGSPNVLVILIDDVGFGTSSVFGGPCHTPNFKKLAKIAVIDLSATPPEISFDDVDPVGGLDIVTSLRSPRNDRRRERNSKFLAGG